MCGSTPALKVAVHRGATASNFVRTSGAGTAWAQGNTGQGIGVAVIDSGISSHNDFAGRVVYGPDLSGDPGNLGRKGVELVHHHIDGVLEFEDFPVDVHRDLSR